MMPPPTLVPSPLLMGSSTCGPCGQQSNARLRKVFSFPMERSSSASLPKRSSSTQNVAKGSKFCLKEIFVGAILFLIFLAYIYVLFIAIAEVVILLCEFVLSLK